MAKCDLQARYNIYDTRTDTTETTIPGTNIRVEIGDTSVTLSSYHATAEFVRQTSFGRFTWKQDLIVGDPIMVYGSLFDSILQRGPYVEVTRTV